MNIEIQDVSMISELAKIFVYIVVPGLAGITFFALAKFVKQVAPLRALVSSEQVYRIAFWGFLVFGIYLGLRPVQVLAGPHPWPLIISSIREFLLIAMFGPAAFIAMATLCFGPEKIGKAWMIPLFGFGLVLGAAFCWINTIAIGGSEEIVKLGMMTAYDGLWFKSGREDITTLMQLLFIIRLVNPCLLLLAGGTLVLLHAKNYPKEKRQIYDNMPKKLYLLSAAVYVYAVSLIVADLFYGAERIPDQSGFYPVGCLIAGILETISLSMPVRGDVQVSEHLE